MSGPQREALILIPRGNGKTTLMALVALHHLVSTDGARIYCVASSRDQARILYEAAADFARELDHENIVHRHLELRWCEDPEEPTVFSRHLRVLAADGPKIHGLSPTLMILDELQAVTRADLYEALASALHKRPDSKLVTISTAGSGADSPLGRLRQRALGLPSVTRRGALTDARGPDLRMLGWAVPAEAELERKTARERAEMWIAPLVEPEAAELRSRCEAWGAQHVEELAGHRPDLLGLFNRAAEVWWPLLAIAEQAGGDWEARARSATSGHCGADGLFRVGRGEDGRHLRDAEIGALDAIDAAFATLPDANPTHAPAEVAD